MGPLYLPIEPAMPPPAVQVIPKTTEPAKVTPPLVSLQTNDILPS